jgi:hypothetical protein
LISMNSKIWYFLYVWVFICTYSGEYVVCDVTLSVHPYRTSWEVCLSTVGIELSLCGCTLGITSCTNIIFNCVHNTNTHKKYHQNTLISKELDSVSKYHQLEPTWSR